LNLQGVPVPPGYANHTDKKLGQFDSLDKSSFGSQRYPP